MARAKIFEPDFAVACPSHGCSDWPFSAAEKTTCTHTVPANFRPLTQPQAEADGFLRWPELVLPCSCLGQAGVAPAVPAPPTQALVETVVARRAQPLRARAGHLLLAAAQAWPAQVGPARHPQPAARLRVLTDPAQQPVKFRSVARQAARPAQVQARSLARLVPLLAQPAGRPAMRRRARPARQVDQPPRARRLVRAAVRELVAQAARQQQPVQAARQARAARRR